MKLDRPDSVLEGYRHFGYEPITVDVSTGINGLVHKNAVRLRITSSTGNRAVLLLPEEVDDLIVALLYYKKRAEEGIVEN